MNECFNCMYMHPDWDVNGKLIRPEHCHFDGPDEWAPCADEEYEEPDYDDEIAYHEFLADSAREEELLSEARWVHEFGQPYDYQEW